MRYLIRISYDGSKFYGFQRLKGHVSVQGMLEKALSTINKSEVLVKGAGRTDRGVHACDQCVSFDLDVFVPVSRLKNAINSLVKPYIYVKSAKVVDDNFHARFNVKEKIYQYVINLGEFDAIRSDYLYNYNRELNIKSMKKSSKKLIGSMSYKAFVSGEKDNYNSTIYNITFKRKDDLLYITFKGTSFYRYMVRNLVGALILVGEEKITALELEDMILSGENKYHYTTVPANGLYLEKVKY